jgi:hypothetical protein
MVINCSLSKGQTVKTEDKKSVTDTKSATDTKSVVNHTQVFLPLISHLMSHNFHHPTYTIHNHMHMHRHILGK